MALAIYWLDDIRWNEHVHCPSGWELAAASCTSLGVGCVRKQLAEDLKELKEGNAQKASGPNTALAWCIGIWQEGHVSTYVLQQQHMLIEEPLNDK